jgi:hypothetical protein
LHLDHPRVSLHDEEDEIMMNIQEKKKKKERRIGNKTWNLKLLELQKNLI